MDEFEFIDRVRPKFYRQPSLIKGIGDDAAVCRTSEDIVTAADTFVENVHFSKQTTSAYHIGWRALAANVSDIAAMGGTPKFYLMSLVIPDTKSESFLMEMHQGMQDLASIHEMDLIGGDTVAGHEFSIAITIIGYVSRGYARYRSAACKDDIVFVSGTLGDSRVGLELLLSNIDEAKDREHYIKSHQLPEPKVELAEVLQQFDRVALNDVSDGIANELQEIAQASNVTIVIDDKQIPVYPSFEEFSSDQQFNWKYFGGEDFELIGTISQSNWKTLEKAASEKGIKVTAIGSVIQKQQDTQVILRKNGMLKPLLKKGYTHLKQVDY